MTVNEVLYYDDTYDDELIDFLRRIKRIVLTEQARMRQAQALTAHEEALVERIRRAFAGITVGPDTTLYLSGEAEDDYMDEECRDILRRREIRDDWQSIPPELLLACDCATSYVDAEGMRYLLPAWMLTELRYPDCVNTGLEIALSDNSDDPDLLNFNRKKLILLNDEQRACVRDCIRTLRLKEFCDDEDELIFANLLPWEEDDRAAHYPHLSAEQYATQDLLRYCEQHGLSRPARPEFPVTTPPPASTLEEQAELRRLFREEQESKRRFYREVVVTLKKRLNRKQKELAMRIRKAFAGVRAGADTPLYLTAHLTESQYGAEFIRILRSEEIRDDWQRIPADILYANWICLHGLTPEGMRYLLPAYMLIGLEIDLPLFLSGRDSFFLPKQLSLFTPEQLACVDDFFRLLPKKR